MVDSKFTVPLYLHSRLLSSLSHCFQPPAPRSHSHVFVNKHMSSSQLSAAIRFKSSSTADCRFPHMKCTLIPSTKLPCGLVRRTLPCLRPWQPRPNNTLRMLQPEKLMYVDNGWHDRTGGRIDWGSECEAVTAACTHTQPRRSEAPLKQVRATARLGEGSRRQARPAVHLTPSPFHRLTTTYLFNLTYSSLTLLSRPAVTGIYQNGG